MGNAKSRPPGTALGSAAAAAAAAAAPIDATATMSVHSFIQPSSPVSLAAEAPSANGRNGPGAPAAASSAPATSVAAAAATTAAGNGPPTPTESRVAVSNPLPMPARKACLEDFVLLQTVGKGSFGKVVMVRALKSWGRGGGYRAHARACVCCSTQSQSPV